MGPPAVAAATQSDAAPLVALMVEWQAQYRFTNSSHFAGPIADHIEWHRLLAMEAKIASMPATSVRGFAIKLMVATKYGEFGLDGSTGEALMREAEAYQASARRSSGRQRNERPSPLRPRGCPPGTTPARWQEVLRARVVWQMTRLDRHIAVLDRMDGDADFEPSLGALERTPSPWGWSAVPGDGSQEQWSAGNVDELEESDGDDEPDAESEPSLGWRDLASQASIATERTFDPDCEATDKDGGDVLDEPHDGFGSGDEEPSLGRLEHFHQGGGAYAATADIELVGGVCEEAYAEEFGLQ